MRFLTKLAVVAGLAVMPLSMAGTAAFASVSVTQPSCSKAATKDCTPDRGGNQFGGSSNDKGNKNWGNGGGYTDPGKNNCDTLKLGGLIKQYTDPNNCYTPKPDPKNCDTRSFLPYGGNNCYTPKPQPEPRCSTSWDNHSRGSYDAITLRRTVRDYCSPGDGWNWQQGQDNWYDPSNQDWYYPVTGWTGGYQDSSGCWHYPSQHGYTDNNYRHTVTYKCTPKLVSFLFAPSTGNLTGSWLLETRGPKLHNGETVIYNGNFWTVNDWDAYGNGSLGNGLPYFVLNHGTSASDITGGGTATYYASIPCTPVRSLR